MDPISATASMIALISFSRKLLQGLKVLRQFSTIPDDIEALLDELQNFQDILSTVCTIIKQRSDMKAVVPECSDELKSLLLKASGLFTTIASYCGITIGQQQQGDGQEESASLSNMSPKLDLLTKFRWLKDRKRIEYLRRRLEVLRLDIANHLASLSLCADILPKVMSMTDFASSVDSCSTLVELRDLAVAFRQLSVEHSTLQASLSNTRLDFTKQDTMHGIRPASHLINTDEDGLYPKGPDSSPFDLRRVHQNPISSMSNCSCSCHRISTIKTPEVIQNVVGALALKLQGIPSISLPCNEIACRRSKHSTFKFSYRFPPWLLNRAINSVLIGNRIEGPQMSLACTRIIPRNSDIFCFAMQGKISSIKDLFERRLASPFDASHNYGYTALHYAIDYGHLDLCEFLLKAGARLDVQDFNNRTSTDIAYHNMCVPTFDGRNKERVQSLFDEESWLEEKQFTTLHKIVLCLTKTHRFLTDELFLSTKEIDTPDSEGRTPISWAAERGDQTFVSVLVNFGANLNLADKDGNTPLHYVCKSGPPDLLTLLLTNGAVPTSRNKWGQTPLNWASFHQNDPFFAETLLQQQGVELDEVDCHGSTAVCNAAFSSHEKMVAYLLRRGADINPAAVYGTNPLLDCISRNNHASLAILLELSFQCRLNLAYRDPAGEMCLHYLARRADVETVTVFLQAVQRGSVVDVSGLDTAHVGKDGLTARDLLTLRNDDAVTRILEQALVEIDREVASERGSERSDEIQYLDAMELLPQLEKDIGLKAPVVTVMEVLDSRR